MSADLRPTLTPFPAREARNGLLDRYRQHAAIVRRNLMKVAGDPGQLLDATVMPLVLSVAFVFVLGGAIAGDSTRYAQFFIPGMVALNLTIMSRSTGIALAVDFASGVVDRFRAMPIASLTVLTGRVISDALRMLLSVLVILGFGFAIGFRISAGPLATVVALALFLGYGIALCWISALIGIAARGMQTAQNLTMLWMVPVQFASSVFVPSATMPTWLRAVAEVNPMTVIVDATRGLLTTGTYGWPVVGSLAWILVLTAVFATLSVRRYRRR
ncbi:ABC transporter permease [Sciscionella sediminilitoris]|uniref:ABC transporter permease n=1 Tax=Sciscionella sediminilitoris TaxID=1445613 RepID=UPI000566F782|nr:ABC transporter permease [Sciscionella sp. SE31]